MNNIDAMTQETKVKQVASALADYLLTGNRQASIELARLIRADESKTLGWFARALTDELHKWPVTTRSLETGDVVMILQATARHLLNDLQSHALSEPR